MHRLLNGINVNKASGPDDILGIVLKNCSNHLAYPLSLVFKLIYNTGTITSQWKLSNVVPIHKKGDDKDVTNYRPISLLCTVSKILERIMHDEIISRTLHLIDKRQHGFLPRKSCATNLLCLIDDVAQNLHKKVGTDIIYFDFAKAFDTVSHDKLLYKLKSRFNIDGRLLKFLQDYLKNRRQNVVLNNIKSETLEVHSGVPQGSKLGPLLFVLFIDDIYQCIDSNTNIALYADDTKIWKQIVSEADCDSLQRDIDALNNWCIDNKMKLNPEKCKALTITTNDISWIEELPLTKFYYTLGDNIIDYSMNERDLGVNVNVKMNFEEHQTSLINKAYQLFGITKRICNFIFDRQRKRCLYLAMIRSQFEHCSIIWRPKLQHQIDKFEQLQKRAIKWILNENYISYSDLALYYRKCKQVNILPISKRFELNDLIFFHEIVYQHTEITMPPYIQRFTGRSRLRNNKLDRESFVYAPELSGSSGSNSMLYKSFFFRVIHLWNNLSLDIKTTVCCTTFKKLVTQFLWTGITSICDVT